MTARIVDCVLILLSPFSTEMDLSGANELAMLTLLASRWRGIEFDRKQDRDLALTGELKSPCVECWHWPLLV